MTTITRRLLAIPALCAAFAGTNARAAVSVLTVHNDTSRSGANLQETVLTREYVNFRQFGRLFTRNADSLIWAQPLYVPNVTVPSKGVHNIVYVGSIAGTLYAWDADSNTGANATALWQKSLVPVGAVSQAGVLGTPVIDPVTNTLYTDIQTYESGHTVHRIHAVDIRDGSEKPNSPVVVAASVPGNGPGSVNHVMSFQYNAAQRPGLLLLNGVVYVSYGAYDEEPGNPNTPPFHGWLIGFDATTLQMKTAFCVTPNGEDGGIWMSGGGPAVDDNRYIYITTGNGTFDANTGGGDYGDTVVKLDTVGGLHVVDYGTPMNQADLDSQDLDMGSSGPVFLPYTTGDLHREMAVVTKTGFIYVLDRDNLGGYSPTLNPFLETLQGPVVLAHTTPAIFKNNVYFCEVSDAPRSYTYSGGGLQPSAYAATSYGYPGATGSISANGTSDGILWMVDPTNSASNGMPILRAYNADDLTQQLYSADQNVSSADGDLALRFDVPTIANGKVYFGSAKQLSVYGLLPPLQGDVNNDGIVNGADAALALKMAAGLTPAHNLRCADIAPTGGDGRVTMTDAAAIARRIVGL